MEIVKEHSVKALTLSTESSEMVGDNFPGEAKKTKGRQATCQQNALSI